MLPYRELNGTKYFGTFVEPTEKSSMVDPIVALFDDGTRYAMSSITVASYNKMKAAAHGHKRAETYWSGETKGSHHKLVLRQRPDRHLLLSLYEQAQQVLQVRVDAFGELPSPQPSVVPASTPALQAAIKLMIPIAEKYSAGGIDKNDLKEFKNEELKKVGISGKRVTTKSQPQNGKRKASSLRDAEDKSDTDSVEGVPETSLSSATFDKKGVNVGVIGGANATATRSSPPSKKPASAGVEAPISTEVMQSEDVRAAMGPPDALNIPKGMAKAVYVRG